MLSDLRYAFRQLVKAPGFATTIVVTLALGIGACTVMFSVVDSLLLHPLDAPEPDRLVTLQTKNAARSDLPVSPPDFLDWRNGTRSYASIAAKFPGVRTLTGVDEPRRMRTLHVTAEYFDVMGIKPAIGRAFLPGEMKPGAARVALLNHPLWQDAFGGQADVLGRTIRLNDEPFTIIGVMPANLDRVGGTRGWNDVVLPLVMLPSYPPGQRGWRTSGFVVEARLKPGVTVGEAQKELDLLCEQLAQQYPDTNKGFGGAIVPILELQSAQLRPGLWALFGAVGGVLIIACANIANLLLVRATTRQREISIRTAFGAPRFQLVRLLLTESLVLSLAGGAAGTLLAVWGINVLRNLQFHSSVGLGHLAYLKLDPGMFGFALGLSVATALVFGLAPAWLASRCDVIEGLKRGARGATEARSRGRLRGALVVAEVSGSLVLLAGVGLLLRSFDRLTHADLGFDPKPLAYANVSLRGPRYQTNNAPNPQAFVVFADALRARLRALPGVESAGAAFFLPGVSVGGDNTLSTFSVGGRPELPVSERPVLQWNTATHDFFATVGIRLLRGRLFTEHDTARSQRVAIISETLARTHFGTEDPVGQRIRVDIGRSGWSQIVGVVGDTVMSPGRERLAQCYEPFAQQPLNAIHFVVRTSGDPASVVPFLKPQIHALDPELAVPWATTISGQMGALATIARQRFILQLLGIFSAVALLIAAVGLHGVIAYSVNRRTSEIGIRMALGARAADVLRLVLGQAARIVGLGLLLGIAGALAAGRAIESMLYQTSAHDPLILATVMLLFALIAAVACWLPARRATKTDPAIALRAE